MNINYKPSQIELFPSNVQAYDDTHRPRFLFANLSLSVESLVILSILGIMMTLFSFAIGVEHGKHLVAQALDERVAQAWNVQARQIAQPIKEIAVVAPVVAAATVSGNKGIFSPKPKTIVQRAPSVIAVQRNVPSSPVKAQSLQGIKPIVAASLLRTTIQLGTYRNEKFARIEALKLRGKGLKTFLIQSNEFWLVCVGQFQTKEEASDYVSKLPAKFRQAKLRRF